MEKKNLLCNLIFDLEYAWKSHFGLYTQYVGYLNPQLVKTLIIVWRFQTINKDKTELTNSQDINKYIFQNNLSYNCHEVLDNKDLDSVIPKLFKTLKKYDLSETALTEKEFNRLLEYLDSKTIEK